MADAPRQDTLSALGRFLVGDITVGETLQRIVDLSQATVPDARYVGVSMLVDGNFETSVFSHQVVCDIDEVQYRTDRGPCLDAFRHRRPFAISSTSKDTRWPEFCRAAKEHGVNSTLSLPLAAGEMSLGALNLYAEVERAFSEDTDLTTPREFATQAAVLLANVKSYWDARMLSEQLAEALESRATIEQAKGIVMAQSHVSPDAAFDMLRRASQRENRKLRDIARELVERHSGGTSSA